MTARPMISALPSAGVSIEGIVDVLGGKSIAYPFTVGPANNYVLKGQATEANGNDGTVRWAEQNCTLDNFRGVAITSALQEDEITIMRHGIARMVYAISTNLVVGVGISIWGFGKVCAIGEVGEDGSSVTDNLIGYVSKVGPGYVDVEINMMGEEQAEFSDSSKSSLSVSKSSESSLSSSSDSLSSGSSNSSLSSVSVSSESSKSSVSSLSSDSSDSLSSESSKLSLSSESSKSSVSSLSSDSSESSKLSVSSLSSDSSESSTSSTV